MELEKYYQLYNILLNMCCCNGMFSSMDIAIRLRIINEGYRGDYCWKYSQISND